MNYDQPCRWRRVRALAWSAVDRGFEPRSGQTKVYKIGICWFLAKHAALRRKSKERHDYPQTVVSVS